MALRKLPYLPLYIQDFLTDEKLAHCSAKATGVYVRLMCIMHKSEEYGKILLKQKYKQSNDPIKNFGALIAKQMPYDFHTVTESLVELLEEEVLTMEGDILIQKRMVRDCAISEKRAIAGKAGGQKKKTVDFAKAKTKANSKANPEYENEYEHEIVLKKGGEGGKRILNAGPPDEIIFYTIEHCLTIAMADDRWVRANKTSEKELEEFNKLLEQRGVYEQNPKEYKSHFANWKRKGKKDDSLNAIQISDHSPIEERTKNILKQVNG